MMFITNRNLFILPAGSATLKFNGVVDSVSRFATEGLWFLAFPLRLLSIPQLTHHKQEMGSLITGGYGTGPAE